MFLGVGKKNLSKKTETSVRSSKILSSPSRVVDVSSGSSKTTVQTTAGPLLSSTRFNSVVDASTFANVNSPGFTSRVVNSASSNSSPFDNTATHHSKYSSVGLFPRVQLGRQSVLPLLSPRNSQKIGRTPVRVRIAPPSFPERRRHSFCVSTVETSREKPEPLKRSPSYGPACQTSDGSQTPLNKHASSPENIQEASRKRIFSECLDSFQDETKKRRRKTEIPIPNPNNDVYHYRHVRAPAVPANPPPVDTSAQGKRAREKGSPEEQQRQKRKVSNINNAIFSSLSSSRNLLERLTAQKRKSVNSSRPSSPLTPPSGKQVKESKTLASSKPMLPTLESASQIDKAPNKSSLNNTPISTKTLARKPELETDLRDRCVDKAPASVPSTPSCDYTTKLFRKEVLSHSPRTPSSKTPKQSLWIQAPEADELMCSLLNDDSKPERPERLKSLLAQIRGKEVKADENKSVVSSLPSTSTSTEKNVLLAVSLPSNTSSKTLSPSSALTVTVSSTCTIMTSATVTSVNGIPSSESSRQHPPGAAPGSISKVSQASSGSTLPNPDGISFSSTGNELKSSTSLHGSTAASLLTSTTCVSSKEESPIRAETELDPSFSKSAFQFGSVSSSTLITQAATSTQSSSNKVPANTLPSVSSLPSGLDGGKANMVSNAAVELPAKSSSSLPTNSTTGATPSFSFGSSSSSSSGATKLSQSENPIKSTIQFGSGSAASQVTVTSAKLPETTTSIGVTSSGPSGFSTPAFSFGQNLSSSSDAPKQAFSFGQNSSGSSQGSKPAFSFGQNGASSTEGSKPALSFGQNGVSSTEGSKPAFSFGHNGSNPTETTKPVISFGSKSSNSTGATKSTFSFGQNGSSSTGGSKPAFSFGQNGSSSSEGSKPAFSFGQNGSSSTGATKSAISFGQQSSNSSEAPKQAVSFGQVGGSSAQTSQGAFSFGQNGGSSVQSSKSAFSFGQIGTCSSEASKPAFSFGQNGTSSTGGSKPAFSFGQSVNCSTETPKTAFPFGQSSNGPAEASKPAFSFSINSNTPTGASKATFGLGSNNSNAIEQNKSSFSFGSSAAPSSAKPSFQFTSNSEKPVFGTAIQGPSSAFSQVPQQPKEAFSFNPSAQQNQNGSNPNPSFGFGSSNSKTSSFGSTSAMPTFGNSSQTASVQPSQPYLTDPKANGFGSSASFGTTGASSFSFNPSSQSSSTPAQPGYSFGQKQDQNPSFSFSATVTAMPNASQSPGLFSVGSGSTGQRRVANARRRR